MSDPIPIVLTSFAILSTVYCLAVLYRTRDRFTTGLLKRMVDSFIYMTINMFIYTLWLLMITTGFIVVPDSFVRELPAIDLAFLFIATELYIKDLGKLYGFGKS